LQAALTHPGGKTPGLAATGLVWARYSTQIVPVNYSLMTVNGFVAATGLYQCYRIWRYVRARASESG
jgi:mitochondrial pyruvate carrier 2